jgi:hypothetical protein
LQNPWVLISLSDYEKHMESKDVLQLQTLNKIMQEQLSYNENTISILGVAGGNGLEHISTSHVDTVYIIDINAQYLEHCINRFTDLSKVLQPICCDLCNEAVILPASRLLICNLIIEYLGLDVFTNLIRKNLQRLHIISCIIQKNNGCSFVSNSETSERLDCLNALHQDINREHLINSMSQVGLHVIYEAKYELPNNKEFIRIDFQIS